MLTDAVLLLCDAVPCCAPAAMKVWGPLYDLEEVEQALAGNNPDAVSSSTAAVSV